MLNSPSQRHAPRPARWRMALLSGLALAAVAGVVGRGVGRNVERQLLDARRFLRENEHRAS